MSPAEAAQYFQGLGQALSYELARAVQDGIDDLIQTAETWPGKGADPFRGGWQGRGPARSGDTLYGEVYNSRPVARRFEQWRGQHPGARLVDDVAADDVEPRFVARVGQAIDDALEP